MGRLTLLSTYRRSQDLVTFLRLVTRMTPLFRLDGASSGVCCRRDSAASAFTYRFLFEFASIFASLQGFESIGLDVVFREFSAAASLVDKLFVF